MKVFGNFLSQEKVRIEYGLKKKKGDRGKAMGERVKGRMNTPNESLKGKSYKKSHMLNAEKKEDSVSH
jgi:hypothetical protein